ncbi:MAG TPA: hypothetical protein VFS40_09915 [Gemmatimonadales bacterium]|nr:hypothetical protein [Gemmatimonadales bacterium]
MGKLFAVLVALITLVSTGIFVARIWWPPPDISTLGIGIDRQLTETMVAAGVLFVAAQLTLAVFAWRYGGRSAAHPIRVFPGGAAPMVGFAVVLVGLEIAVLTLIGTRVWSRIFLTPPAPNALAIDVQAEQFAYCFRYPGPDGKLGAVHPELMDEGSGNFFGLDPANDTAARDDIISATLEVPVGRPILLTLHAKDVGHSFYVPDLRLQQDFVPGLTIPLHFTATRATKREIVCTQLCGLGHYNMRAYLEVLPPDRFAQWLKEQSPE